jgi:thiazole synthase ThiGH ThiG subunit
MVTVAVNRVPLDRKTESFLDYLNPEMQILPNTAVVTMPNTRSARRD